jgi:anti-sigma factor RsiW
MIHPERSDQLDAYLDDELAGSEAREMEEHLASCADCGRAREDRLALRAAIRARMPSLVAPDALRRRVNDAIVSASPIGPIARRERQRLLLVPRAETMLALAASLAIVAVGSWQLALRQRAGDDVAGEVLQSHLRSLTPGHLTDVVSSDRHTVKPWFNGRLAYSPRVPDLSTDGFPLLGGRLEYLGGRPVAALVYGRRQHVINVFVWPSALGGTSGPARDERQGYHALHFAVGSDTYWVISDLGESELAEFTRLLLRADAAEATRP